MKEIEVSQIIAPALTALIAFLKKKYECPTRTAVYLACGMIYGLPEQLENSLALDAQITAHVGLMSQLENREN